MESAVGSPRLVFGAVPIGVGVGLLLLGAWTYFTPPAASCSGPFACTTAPFLPGYSVLADTLILAGVTLIAAGLAALGRALIRSHRLVRLSQSFS